MKNLIIIVLLLILVSCSSEESKNDATYSIDFEMIVKNSDGADLLNPNTPNTFNTPNIKLFYLKKGILEEVYSPTADFPRNYKIYQHIDGIYRIGIFPNDSKSENLPVTHIEWNATDTDTIKGEFYYSENAVIIQKVWFNDELRLDFSNGRTFEIVK